MKRRCEPTIKFCGEMDLDKIIQQCNDNPKPDWYIEAISNRFQIGENFKKFGYEKNWMLHNSYYKYLSKFIEIVKPKRILELGTQIGSGTATMVFDESVQEVVTADVNISEVSEKVSQHERVRLIHLKKPEDCFSIFDFTQFDLIFVDIGHDGVMEYKIHCELIKQMYKGIVLWDDIELNDSMKHFWHLISEEKSRKTMWHDACGFGVKLYE